jgi:hypothetical protein
MLHSVRDSFADNELLAAMSARGTRRRIGGLLLSASMTRVRKEIIMSLSGLFNFNSWVLRDALEADRVGVLWRTTSIFFPASRQSAGADAGRSRSRQMGQRGNS